MQQLVVIQMRCSHDSCAWDLKTRKLREWNKESPFKENIEGVFAQKERAEEGELWELEF